MSCVREIPNHPYYAIKGGTGPDLFGCDARVVANMRGRLVSPIKGTDLYPVRPGYYVIEVSIGRHTFKVSIDLIKDVDGKGELVFDRKGYARFWGEALSFEKEGWSTSTFIDMSDIRGSLRAAIEAAVEMALSKEA